MYCGDETGSFIGDVGSHTSRFGYGGDDAPTLVTPSYVTSSSSSVSSSNNDNDSNNDTVNPDNPKKRKANKTTTRYSIPRSCYKPLDADTDCRAPLRQAASSSQQPTSSQDPHNHHHHPIVDPAQYLQQGQDIVDFEAYEQLWQAAFDTLRVRDRFKHTVGGGSLQARTTDNEEGAAASQAVSTASSGVTSTTIRPSLPEHACVHPLLAVVPGFTATSSSNNTTSSAAQAAAERKQRIQLTEFLMETLDCPAMFLAPSPMLAAFSHGRQTALVVDVGAGGTRVTPVVDGFLLKQAQRRTGRGGDWLSHVQWKALLDHKTVVRPRYLQPRGGSNISSTITTTTASMSSTHSSGRGIFHQWAMQELMQELRMCEYVSLPKGGTPEALSTASSRPFFVRPPKEEEEEEDQEEEEGDGEEKEDAAAPMEVDDGNQEKGDNDEEEEADPKGSEAATFELPDGTLIDLTTDLGKDLRRIPELLFAPKVPFLDESGGAASAFILNQHATFSNLPLHHLIHASLSAVGDIDSRKDLASSILLTGGSSLFAGMEERLSYEVSQQATYKTKVLASKHSVERSYASWIGGSILTSLGSFQQLWLGRTEYDEYGVTLALQRFP